MSSARLLFGAAALLMAGSPALSAEWVVDAAGGGTHQTVRAALSAAADGDRITVLPGLYRERINFLGKQVTVCGSDPGNPSVVAATVIDGGDAGTVAIFAAAENAGSVLEGLTLRNGQALYGGGVACLNGASPTLRHNRIEANYAASHGGGVYVASGSAPLLTGNTLTGNACDGRGAGLYAEHSALRVEGNTISDNVAGCSSGGGLHLAVGCDEAVVIGNVITRNGAIFGGGVQTEACGPRIERNWIVGNTGNTRGGGLSSVDGLPRISNNVLAGNRAPIAAAAEFNNADAVFRHNTVAGNLAGQAVVLAINGSDLDLAANIFAFHEAGFAVQTVAGTSAAADYNCFFANTGGDTTGPLAWGAHNFSADPGLVARGAWLAGIPRIGPACGGPSLTGVLDGPGGRSGLVDYAYGPKRDRFTVDVDGFPTGVFDVSIDGTVAGQISVGGNGNGTLDYDSSAETFPPGFPDATVGSVVSVGGLAAGALTTTETVYSTYWSAGDEHLAVGSPCRGAGPPAGAAAADIDGQPRLAGSPTDVGADQHWPPGTGDTDADGDVDLADVAVLQICYAGADQGLRLPTCVSVDLDADVDVDSADVAALIPALTGP